MKWYKIHFNYYIHITVTQILEKGQVYVEDIIDRIINIIPIASVNVIKDDAVARVRYIYMLWVIYSGWHGSS